MYPTDEITECPCCGSEREDSPFMSTRICPVCGWEDDPDAGITKPSALNGDLTLDEAQLNFRVFGTIHLPADAEE